MMELLVTMIGTKGRVNIYKCGDEYQIHYPLTIEHCNAGTVNSIVSVVEEWRCDGVQIIYNCH